MSTGLGLIYKSIAGRCDRLRKLPDIIVCFAILTRLQKKLNLDPDAKASNRISGGLGLYQAYTKHVT
jgi:hypothetical protein